MTKRQFRVLYRVFLFRMVDLEVLSVHAEGDANKLLGQFASLLVFVSVMISFGGVGFLDAKMSPDARLGLTVYMEHFLVATTMLVVGVFAVLCWDSTFPDHRDVLVLSPLPLRARTMFLAKVAASATALGLVVVLLHSAAGLIWPLAFAVQATPQQALTLAFDPTPAPLSVTGLKPELDRALRQARTSGWLTPGKGGGLVIGVSQLGVRRVFAYGAANPDSLFEIGSISKTFTGLILARMVRQGKARFDEPVRVLLPVGTVPKPAGMEISLIDLATHHSGLPPMPDNFPIEKSNPCGDYRPNDLYAYLAKHGVEKTSDASFLYSNLGQGLLGQALAVRAGMSYPNLLREEVAGPLGLSDTVVLLSEVQKQRFMQGLNAEHHAMHSCDLDGLAGGGGIRSTAGDMLTYLEAQLHPEKFDSMTGALAESHRLRAEAPAGLQIALAWFCQQGAGVYWHDGATPGFGSAVFFDPRHDAAAVVLANIGSNPIASSTLIAEHIRQRFSGEPAVSLDTVLVPASSGFPGLVQWFAAYWFTMLSAGAFIYLSLLGVQGLAAQILPQWLFLRSSGLLQMAAFCLLVGVYFLQPGVGGIETLIARQNAGWLRWVPSYWFLGLFHELNGSMHPVLAPLARRAWMGLGISTLAAVVAHALSWVRTLRQIVEQPEISSGARSVRWLPRFGNQVQTAIGQFTIRTLARSRQHRLILAFYWGIGLAFTIFLLQTLATSSPLPDGPASEAWHEANTSLLSASVIMIMLAVVGARVVFTLPTELRANWIFRSVGVQGGPETLSATRRALLLLSVAPVWLATAVVCLQLWPWHQAAAHLMVLGLLGVVLIDLSLHGFRKIPFACSYLPGKSQVHMVFLAACGLGWFVHLGVTFERQALQEPRTMAVLLVLLAAVAVGIRLGTAALARSETMALQFEELPAPVVQQLELHRDGVMTVGSPDDH
jgi:CubicO group peptidase (beta-lactamase class C family)